MDSSFLTGLHISLGLFACLQFLKMTIQFGLPNHPARLISYLIGLCVAVYFLGLGLTDLNFFAPWIWMKWRVLPLVTGSLSLLLQSIILFGSFSLFQQKLMARIPIMAALLCFAFFSDYADTFTSLFLGLGGVFLIISVKKARHQKRLYFKLLLLFFIHLGLICSNHYVAYIISQLFLFVAVFYLFLFEQSVCLAAMVDDFKVSLEGDPR